MDIYEFDRWIMDLMQRYEDGDITDEESYFLNNLRADLNNLLG